MLSGTYRSARAVPKAAPQVAEAAQCRTGIIARTKSNVPSVHSDAISAAEIAKRCLGIPPTVIAERGGAHVVSQAEACSNVCIGNPRPLAWPDTTTLIMIGPLEDPNSLHIGGTHIVQSIYCCWPLERNEGMSHASRFRPPRQAQRVKSQLGQTCLSVRSAG
jgi:hypothetical protein